MSTMSTEIIERGSYLKKLFLQWAADNPELFTHQPYLLRQGKGFFVSFLCASGCLDTGILHQKRRSWPVSLRGHDLGRNGAET